MNNSFVMDWDEISSLLNEINVHQAMKKARSDPLAPRFWFGLRHAVGLAELRNYIINV